MSAQQGDFTPAQIQALGAAIGYRVRVVATAGVGVRVEFKPPFGETVWAEAVDEQLAFARVLHWLLTHDDQAKVRWREFAR